MEGIKKEETERGMIVKNRPSRVVSGIEYTSFRLQMRLYVEIKKSPEVNNTKKIMSQDITITAMFVKFVSVKI
ncbi:hypothetical protein KL86DYS1_30975 [uncultured Dysgonomonas sp.]|uniref:Uncharacterized protein n=1 Tax=uncultured Dysgonomonas sp. TaxID=206096 RepID=A0A212JZV0_9BACT|nr:hypothetical protein KL86DYS1_30975 [uncultured Dysgonomonas sp.]